MPREERLSARPIERIAFEGHVGWLYLWNNGDTQMLWLNRPPRRIAAAPTNVALRSRRSTARKDCN